MGICLPTPPVRCRRTCHALPLRYTRHDSLLFFTIFYRLVNTYYFRKNPANLLRPDSIVHISLDTLVLTDLFGNMETAHDIASLEVLIKYSSPCYSSGYWNIFMGGTYLLLLSQFEKATWKFPSLCCALPRHTENRHP